MRRMQCTAPPPQTATSQSCRRSLGGAWARRTAPSHSCRCMLLARRSLLLLLLLLLPTPPHVPPPHRHLRRRSLCGVSAALIPPPPLPPTLCLPPQEDKERLRAQVALASQGSGASEARLAEREEYIQQLQ